ncbi:MAG: AMP-binding protein [Salinicola sp.]|uniref:AMP-binding protein n=1 Tax=Salinicola sp. TaxID=1978524 RepID=UPI001DE7B074|nr:AMP-binding protein [Salinicola sp.]NRB56100.1 AMP-binding protein [Salinicola sp.]
MTFRRLGDRPWRDRPQADAIAWIPPKGDTPSRWLTVGEWHGRIGAWQQRLLETPNESDGWRLFEPDPVEFSAALVAIWERGDRVVLPADNQPKTLTALHGTGVALGPAEPMLGSDGSQSSPGRAPQWDSRPLPAVAVSLYTSGSSGEPQRLDKRFDQLDAELATQASLWPLAGRLVVSQVSHQHIYGLLFSILRPLCENSPFATQPCRYPETLYTWLQYCQATGKRMILVSAPPALSRLPEALDWKPASAALETIYSSGAPLSRSASDLVHERLGTPVHEVYGSSETGGIAWRVQQRESAWTALPGVEVSHGDDNRLWLRSRHLEIPDQWQRQADLIALTDRGFELLGRADRIVKIGGKRISLTAMDRALSGLPGVERAQTLTLQRRDLRLAAIVQLSPSEVPHDHRQHRDTVKRLRRALAAHFETPVLPRYWRFVAPWPTNAQGKLGAEIRQRLFLDLEDRRAPRWLGERVHDSGWRVTLEVPEHCAYVDGHFDGQPVLPGIALVHWAMQQARRLFALTSDFDGLERLRFPQPLLPGDRFEMSLEHRRGDGTESLRLECDSRRGKHVSGRIARVDRQERES